MIDKGAESLVQSPMAILDAGGDIAVQLERALYRCIDEILPGQVLQVISRDPRARADVAKWCRVTGHTLLLRRIREDETLFWICHGGQATPIG